MIFKNGDIGRKARKLTQSLETLALTIARYWRQLELRRCKDNLTRSLFSKWLNIPHKIAKTYAIVLASVSIIYFLSSTSISMIASVSPSGRHMLTIFNPASFTSSRHCFSVLSIPEHSVSIFKSIMAGGIEHP